MTTKLTISERVESINGHDELAILDAFEHDVWDTWDIVTDDGDTPKKITARFARMLVFTEKVHEGIPPKVALDLVLGMTSGQLNEHLGLNADDEDDDTAAAGDTDPAETPEGKGVSDGS